MKDWVITYEGQELHLNDEEYLRLKNLAYNDPVAAKELAEELLRREP